MLAGLDLADFEHVAAAHAADHEHLWRIVAALPASIGDAPRSLLTIAAGEIGSDEDPPTATAVRALYSARPDLMRRPVADAIPWDSEAHFNLDVILNTAEATRLAPSN